MSNYSYIGKGRPLIDGMQRVTGNTRFVADTQLANMLHIKPVLSSYAHAKIVSIDDSEAIQVKGVVAILKAEDLVTKGKTIVSRNSCTLAEDKVIFVGQPVVVVVAETEAAAADGAALIDIEYEELDAIIHLEDAIKDGAVQVWPDGLPEEDDDMSSIHGGVEEETTSDVANKPNNASKEGHYGWGDIQTGFAEADIVIDRRYKFAAVHQGYIEAHAVIAEPLPLGQGLNMFTSTQGQYAVRSIVAKTLGLAERNVKVEPLAVGGGFGAKYGIYDAMVGAVALCMEQPVKLSLSRTEDFVSSTPAPEIIIELKTGAKNDGSLTAMEARILTNNGVFNFTHGSFMSICLGGSYNWPSSKIDTYEIHTHRGQIGAYRAPGSPQACFAMESNIEDMAKALGLDPLEFRLQNVTEGGVNHGMGNPWPMGIGARDVLERIKTHPLWVNKKEGDAIGIALGAWPAGAGAAEAICGVDSTGTARLSIGTVDISGSNSSFILVAAETLGVSPDDIVVVPTDTNGLFGPASGGSQVTVSTIGAVQEAALGAKKQLIAIAANALEASEDDIEIADGKAHVKGVPANSLSFAELVQKSRKQAGGVVAEGRSNPETNAPPFVANIVKVDIDKETGTVVPTDYVIIQDVGMAVNPLLVEGQMHGGGAQALGMALHEHLDFDDNGQMMNNSFLNYSMPRIDQIPNIETIMIENPAPQNLYGSRGVGEPPIIAAGAAIANAINNAHGVRVEAMPLRTEVLWQALNKDS